MRRFLIFWGVICLLSYTSSGQELTLTELTNICSKNSWEEVNQILVMKDWTFYTSEVNSSDDIGEITWSYGKQSSNDKATGWLTYYLNKGSGGKITYNIFNTSSYTLIQKALPVLGFQSIKSEVEDEAVTVYYANKSFIVNIETRKVVDEDWSERSYTAYLITIIKKAGVFDNLNGRKTEYYDDFYLECEYVNGIMHGPIKVFDYNDQLRKQGYYINGEANGNFVEYNENGEKDAEYTLINGLKTGNVKVFVKGRLSNSLTYKEDVLNGESISYYYDEGGNLKVKESGIFINGKKHGTWKIKVLDDGLEKLQNYMVYSQGIKSGPFQEVRQDSLIISSYHEDKLHGPYRVYHDLSKMLFGGIIRTDTTKLKLLVVGTYQNGKRTGHWKYFDITNALREEGTFHEDMKEGLWKNYYTTISDSDSGEAPYSRQLYLIESYSNGKLNGKRTQYSYLETQKVPCVDLGITDGSQDTCDKVTYHKILETSNYINGLLNGYYELLDSTKVVLAKGNYKDGDQDGEWILGNLSTDENGVVEYSYQKGLYVIGKRSGEWQKYDKNNGLLSTLNYRNGLLHGDYINWNQNKTPIEKYKFIDGELESLTIYDESGLHPKRKYEVLAYYSDFYECRLTLYSDSGYTSQEFRITNSGKIDHNWFEFQFLLSIDSTLTGRASGYRYGTYLQINATDQPIIFGRYNKNNKVGLWTYYYYDQNLKIVIDYLENEPTRELYFTLSDKEFTGEFVIHDSEANIVESRQIRKGKRNGKTIYKDLSTDKIVLKEIYKDGVLQ